MSIKDIDITKNIKIIEWLKSELLNGVAKLFSVFSNNTNDESEEQISSNISNIIIVSYLLAKRLGIEFSEIDANIKEKLETGINENHEIEKRYGDLTLLRKHIQKNRE